MITCAFVNKKTVSMLEFFCAVPMKDGSDKTNPEIGILVKVELGIPLKSSFQSLSVHVLHIEYVTQLLKVKMPRVESLHQMIGDQIPNVT